MIVKYKYRHGDCGNVGWYQTDTDDLKKMLANPAFKEGLYWMVIDVNNGYQIYSRSAGKWYFRKSKAYWF